MRTTEPMVLNEDERAYLQTWVHRGHATARIQTRARILLKLAEGWRDGEIARAVEVGVGTVYNTRQRFLAGGPQEVLHDQRQGRPRQAPPGRPPPYPLPPTPNPPPPPPPPTHTPPLL